MTHLTQRSLLLVVAGMLTLAGCDSNDSPVAVTPPPPADPPAMAMFEVSISNLTNSQPLSPIGVIAHADGYNVFTIGSPATVGLEEQAEGGDNAALLAEADADANVLATASGAAAIGPGGSEIIAIEVLASDLPGMHISTSTMLVNTNDAITVLNASDVSSMAAGDIVSFRTIAYDSGTEANTETAATIPGPAGGGEGFNATRDDIADRVAMHTGIVGQDDGLPTSDLNNQHRFDNPVAEVRIERIN